MHANHFWWVWSLRFWRFCSFLFAFIMGQRKHACVGVILALCVGQSISNCHLTPNVTSAFPVNFVRSDCLSLEKCVLL